MNHYPQESPASSTLNPLFTASFKHVAPPTCLEGDFRRAEPTSGRLGVWSLTPDWCPPFLRRHKRADFQKCVCSSTAHFLESGAKKRCQGLFFLDRVNFCIRREFNSLLRWSIKKTKHKKKNLNRLLEISVPCYSLSPG